MLSKKQLKAITDRIFEESTRYSGCVKAGFQKDADRHYYTFKGIQMALWDLGYDVEFADDGTTPSIVRKEP